jgi:transmembrane sensor
MKPDNKEEILSYEKGVKLAQEILTLLRAGSEKRDLKDMPEFVEWIKENPSAGELLEKLCSEEEFTRINDQYLSKNPAPQVKRFYKSIEQKRLRRKITRLVISISSVAAIALISFYLTITVDKPVIIPQNRSFAVRQEIIQPTLILKTGERVEVDEKSYSEKIELVSRNVDPVQYNKLIVPPKCKFRLELEDGTVVFLNADSELSYPISFRGGARKIFLHRGEAYLEVVKSDKQFEISTENTRIKVYGTKFNVSHYTPDIIQTVLIEGSLGVSLNNINETIIHPGELITLNSMTGDKEIKAVNTRKYLTWVNGFVCCDEEPLKLMLEQVSRWYNVRFKIDKDVNLSIPINAYFSVERPIDEILKSIEDITNIKFTKTEEGEIIVK